MEKNKPAQELFEELGYFRIRKEEIEEGKILYINSDLIPSSILFNSEHKRYWLGALYEYPLVTLPLHKAISKQIEELGWNNE